MRVSKTNATTRCAKRLSARMLDTVEGGASPAETYNPIRFQPGSPSEGRVFRWAALAARAVRMPSGRLAERVAERAGLPESAPLRAARERLAAGRLAAAVATGL